MKCIVCYLIACVLGLAIAEKGRAASVALAWDASASAGVNGYNVYYGTNSGNYPYKVDAGSATSLTISNLVPGTTYYFAATAYDTNNNESAYSPEISFIVPGTIALLQGGNANHLPTVQFPVAPGHWYEIQASTDLQNWTPIWASDVIDTNTMLQYTDPDGRLFATRFYRLVQH